MYAITGASGNIGGKAAEILLAQGEKVRVIGRSAGRLQRLVEKGAEAAVGDLREADFLARAFTAATAVFAMIPPDYTAEDFRAYQNLVGESIATGIKTSGIRNVVKPEQSGSGTAPVDRADHGAARPGRATEPA